jgi:hypothetical protein
LESIEKWNQLGVTDEMNTSTASRLQLQSNIYELFPSSI